MFEPPTEIPETVKSYILTLHLTFNKKNYGLLSCFSVKLLFCCGFFEPFYLLFIS